MAMVITALVVFVYSLFTAGPKTVMVPQNPEDPDSPMVETKLPSDGISMPFLLGSSIFVGLLSGSLASMALTDSGNDFDMEEILDEQF